MTVQGDSEVEQSLHHAMTLHLAGHLHEAEQVLLQVLLTSPSQPTANHHLGTVMLESDRADESLPYFKAALEADPQQAEYWLAYINALIQAMQYEDAKLVLSYGYDAGLSGDAVDHLSKILEDKAHPSAQEKQPDYPATDLEDELIQLFSAKHYEELENRLLTLVNCYPGWLIGWKMLSDTLLVQKKDARVAALKALALNPDDAKEHCYYGLILKSHGDLTGAAMAFEQAVQLKPDYAAAYNNLGIVRKDMGDVEAGIRDYRKALEINPDYASCYSNLLFCLSHSDHLDADALFEAHCDFGRQYESVFKPTWPIYQSQKDAGRRIQVGFVSADFRDHSLAYFIEPILRHLSVSRHLSLHAYSASAIEDDVTQRLRDKFSRWNQVEALSDQALANKIREDGIDILVDLDGHTAGNRLLTFAMKPAPVQVSWLGYLSTTGLTAMDYYLADNYLLPPGEFDHQFTEKLVQLPANAPFTPSVQAPEVNDLPALGNGFITFACFNRIEKITPSVVGLWAMLLQALPDAKMLLGAMPQAGSYDNIIEWFAQHAIDAERLIFHTRGSMESYLELHHEVDICLDTFPSNGVTTTCHAAWMGVPTLCMHGQSLSSRGAMAIMSHVGLFNCIADNQDDYLNKAIHLVSNIENLMTVRATLRDRFATSALNQPALIAGSLDTAFQRMWKNWCQKNPARSFNISG